MKSINEAIVLIVDDTEENVEILVEALGDDYEVSVAMDGESALEAVEEELPDLILLDVMMPDINGYEVCERLKSEPKTASIPIIFLTALTEINDKTKGFEAGAVDYITKPFEILEVRARVKTHLSMYIMSQEIEEQRQVAEANTRAKAEFLATMSHEIRTPMNGVLGMAQLLLETSLDKKQREFAETIYNSGNALLGVINDILDHSKLEAGKLDIETIPFSPKSLVISVERLMVNRAQEKAIDLVVNVANEVPDVVLGDANRIRQILLNFLSNAIKFTERGRIEIVLKLCNNGDLYFSVIDTGIGIDDEGKKKLFQDFSQVDSSISRRYGGTGLGLSICKKIVSIMNGEIGVKSKIGDGSEFWFSIPTLETDKKAIDITESLSSVSLNLPRMNILLAEDNKVNQQVAVGLLGNDKHNITIVENGIEAVHACEEHIFDVVLMDMQMPDMDGIAATIRIREIASEKGSVPIIALTANAMAADQEKCLNAGMTGFVAKPIQADVLIKEIARVTRTVVVEESVEIDQKVPAVYFDTDQLSLLESTISLNALINIIHGFIEEVKPLGTNLPNVALNSDMQQLIFDAHKIKGSSANLAMNVLADTAGKIENFARDGDIKAAQKLAMGIPQIFENTLQEVANMYPEAFKDCDMSIRRNIVDPKICSIIIESLLHMEEAIRAENIEKYEEVTESMLRLELSNLWKKSLGEVDMFVYEGKFSEALERLERFRAIVTNGCSKDEASSDDLRVKLTLLEQALTHAKPKEIAEVLDDLQALQLPEEAINTLTQVAVKVSQYQYKGALEILSGYLR